MRFETLAVHAGGERDPTTGAVAPPIHLSTNYEHGPAGELPHGYLYVREGNPTQDRLEGALAALDGGAAALAYASGMAAGCAYLQALPAGTHVLFQDDLYYGFRAVARELLPRWGMTASAADFRDLDAVPAALRPETGLLWCESPSNPLLKIVDLAAVAELARGAGARLLVDGTFATPALQRPLEHGASVVLHSATKYLGGHGDVMGGVVAAGVEWIARLRQIRAVTGGLLHPLAAYELHRGLQTLPVRVRAQQATAMKVADWLSAQPAVEAVYYPGLSDPQELMGRQQAGPGAVLAFTVAGGYD
ncbi:MAG: trans-sulfuration enzyme family protein, partial [Thermoanaerobaculia bacterium]